MDERREVTDMITGHQGAHGSVVTAEQVTCEGYPFQTEGTLADGRFFYFRYRFGVASLAVGEDAVTISGRMDVSERIGDDLDGVLDRDEYRSVFERLYNSF